MSLQYQPEPAEINETPEEENVQQAEQIVPVYSVVLVVALVAVSLAQFAMDGAEGLEYGGEGSVLRAGFVKPFFSQGEYWRILTGAALHGGIVHLLLNCYALFVLGKLIETLSNRAHLAIVFLLSAIGGGVLSLLFMPEGVSVGASGGIVGFLGYLAVYGFLRRKLLSDAFLKNMLFNIGFIALYGLFMSRVDNYAHLGGLIVGAVYGFIQIPRDLYTDPRQAGSFASTAGLIALVTFLAVCIFSILLIVKII